MKKLIVSSVLVMALFAPANQAVAADFNAEQAIQGLVVSGVVESWNGYTFRSGPDGNYNPDKEDHFSSGIDGRLSLPLGDNLSIQMDGKVEYTDAAFDSSDANDTFQYSSQLGTHLTYRDPNSFAFGAFGAFGLGQGDNSPVDAYAVGGELQFYLNDLTFYLQGGYMDSDTTASNPQDGFHNALFVRGVGRWYITPDSRLQAEFSYANGDQDGIDGDRLNDMDVFEWGVRYDMLVSGIPIVGDTQFFVGYRGFDADNGRSLSDTGAVTEHTIMVGTSHSFGGSSMKETERFGAGLDLPNFMRWASSGVWLD
ncbi:MAG: hypothetical protein ABJM26_06325 [Anderseniella sp.]